MSDITYCNIWAMEHVRTKPIKCANVKTIKKYKILKAKAHRRKKTTHRKTLKKTGDNDRRFAAVGYTQECSPKCTENRTIHRIPKKTFCRAFYQILFPKSGRHSDLLLLVFVDNSATRQSHFSVFCALDGPKI